MTTRDAGRPRSLRIVGDVSEGLQPQASPQERITALQRCGLGVEHIADAIGVSVNTVRNWAGGNAAPRRAGGFALDDLRAAAARLVELGFDSSRAGAWLLSRNTMFLDGQRPIDLIRDNPIEILAAVEHTALEEREKDAEANVSAAQAARRNGSGSPQPTGCP